MSTYQKIITLLEENNISYQARTYEATLTSADSARVRGESMWFKKNLLYSLFLYN